MILSENRSTLFPDHALVQLALWHRRLELRDLCGRRCLAVEGQHVPLLRDRDAVAILDLAGENHLGERVLQIALDHALQRTRAIGGVPTLDREPIACGGIERERDLALFEEPRETGELDFYNPAHLALLQTMEQDNLIDTVEEFGPEMRPHHPHHL